jgi:hypothetical protein
MRYAIVGIVALGVIFLFSIEPTGNYEQRSTAIIAVTVLTMWFTRRK